MKYGLCHFAVYIFAFGILVCGVRKIIFEPGQVWIALAQPSVWMILLALPVLWLEAVLLIKLFDKWLGEQ